MTFENFLNENPEEAPAVLAYGAKRVTQECVKAERERVLGLLALGGIQIRPDVMTAITGEATPAGIAKTAKNMRGEIMKQSEQINQQIDELNQENDRNCF